VWLRGEVGGASSCPPRPAAETSMQKISGNRIKTEDPLVKIDPTRSADVLIAVLGAEFDGVLGCDDFSAYRRYHRGFGVALQSCPAHLSRDVKYLTTLPDARGRADGAGRREAFRQLVAVIHRREGSSATASRGQLGRRVRR
jgi:Transposase IS66 family